LGTSRAHATTGAPTSFPPAPGARRPSTGRTVATRLGAAGFGLIYQSLRIIAISLVKLPSSAEIHTGRRRQRELLACARRQKDYGQSDRSSHGVSLFNDGNTDIARPRLAIVDGILLRHPANMCQGDLKIVQSYANPQVNCAHFI
jgi:hypothetical protein